MVMRVSIVTPGWGGMIRYGISTLEKPGNGEIR